MELKDYRFYKKSNKGGCKSQLKDFIDLYAKILKKVKSENAKELDGVKVNIKRSYKQEVYLTMVDENDLPVRFNLTEKTKDYVIAIFTDVCEYKQGSEKLSKLFLDEITEKLLSVEDIGKIAENDEKFKGIVINPHSQNFMMDREGNI